METLSRMVPFTREVLLRLVEQYNDAIWPAQIVAGLLGLLAAGAAFHPVRGSGRLASTLLAAAWIWTGAGYHMLYTAKIDWAAWAYGCLFVVQGLLFLLTGVARGRLAFRFAGGASGWAGFVLLAAALVLHPLAGSLADPAWPRFALPGIAPAPTMLFTFGMLLLADGRAPWHLLVIPLLGALAAGAGGLLLQIPQDLALPATAAVTVFFAAWKNRLSRVSAA